MRRAAKVDANQSTIVQSLRGIGATVEPLHAVGGGCPDLLVGFRGNNYLIEIKNMKGRGSKLTPDQTEWHGFWNGQIAIAKTSEEAISIVTGGGHDQ